MRPKIYYGFFFGGPTGLLRRFPGTAIKDCGTYDPRIRPWYTSATSGPKDVVIVIDVSGSMGNYGRLDIAKRAAITVLNTLGFADYVNVITFASTAQIIGSSSYLIQAKIDVITELTQIINSVGISGSTNYESAFKLAFDLITRSSLLEYSTNCQKAILFLTDGDITEGVKGSDLLALIKQLNTYNATIFMYTLGSAVSDTGKAECKAIACATNGLYTSIPDGGDLVSAMGYYYKYYATLREVTGDVVFWAEPFLDLGGANTKVTGPSLAIYDDTVSPPILIGVASMNIKLSYFSKIEPNYDILLDALVLRSSTCPKLTLGECQLENFRYHDSFGNNPDKLCGIPNCTFPEIAPPVCIGLAQKIPFCDTPRISYEQEECCTGIATKMYHYSIVLFLVLLIINY